MSCLKKFLLQNLAKPLKIDIRNVCEQNLEGPITRTFLIRRKDLVAVLEETKEKYIVDRVDVVGYSDEDRITLYNDSNVDKPVIPEIRKRSTSGTEWDLEPQYGARFSVEEGI